MSRSKQPYNQFAMPNPRRKVTLAMTGASGALYWLRFLEQLIKADVDVLLLFSTAGQIVLNSELDLDIPNHPKKLAEFFTKVLGAREGQLVCYGKDQWSAPVASGASSPKDMVVLPCTTGALSAIAHGASDNLLERAADVVIKERGRLILVVREMPLSAIHLKNMLELSQIGVSIMPACPGFYFKPQSVDDIVNFVVGKICDQLDIEHELSPQWSKAFL